MGAWEVPADVLAGARFVTSPMADVVGALGMLTGTGPPADRAFVARYAEAFGLMLADEPGRAAVVEHSWRPGWMADFLGLPPRSAGSPSFEDELDQVRSLGDVTLRNHLRVATPSRIPPILDRPGLTDQVTGLLGWIWTHTVAADWPRRARVLRGDVLARVNTIATRGLRGVLKDLGRDREWKDGRLMINRYDLPSRTLPSGAELMLIPVHSSASWVGHDDAGRYAIYYPVSGTGIHDAHGRRGSLTRLLGPNRAAILVHVDQPRSPTVLSHDMNLPVGAVGNHLRILLDAGLVTRRRSGAHVLYWRTATGHDLVASAA